MAPFSNASYSTASLASLRDLYSAGTSHARLSSGEGSYFSFRVMIHPYAKIESR